MSRVLVVFMFAAFVLAPAAASAEEQKGTMERVGAAIDEGFEATKEFFSDSAITARVKKRFIRDDKVSAFDIKVATYDGLVILEGEAPGEEVAQRAVDIARATKGVKDVENRIWIVNRTPSRVK